MRIKCKTMNKSKLISNHLGCPLMSILLLISMLVVLPVHAAVGSPQISITEPKNGSTVSAGDVLISVEVKNFTLVDKLGKPNVAGEGHIHYFMDAKAPIAQGKPAITIPGTYTPTINTSYVWKNVTPGMHNFSVELINNDHTPLSTPVVDEIYVMASAEMLKTMSVSNVTINLIAQNIAFNTSTIRVPAGANVTINFDNQDTNIPHNFAVYETSDANGIIFKGDVITGPRKIVYTFVAPSKPGTYFFRCDIHPTTMTGQFIVE